MINLDLDPHPTFARVYLTGILCKFYSLVSGLPTIQFWSLAFCILQVIISWIVGRSTKKAYLLQTIVFVQSSYCYIICPEKVSQGISLYTNIAKEPWWMSNSFKFFTFCLGTISRWHSNSMVETWLTSSVSKTLVIWCEYAWIFVDDIFILWKFMCTNLSYIRPGGSKIGLAWLTDTCTRIREWVC